MSEHQYGVGDVIEREREGVYSGVVDCDEVGTWSRSWRSTGAHKAATRTLTWQAVE